MLGAHGMREKNVFYEESSHIPLLMRFPGEIEAGSSINGYVSLIDLFPTILDYLNIPEHDSDGVSLRGLIEGTDNEHGQYVVTEWDFRGPVSPNYMILKDGWKLIIPYSKSSTVLNALYDLNTDPHEMNNLIGNNPDAENFAAKAEELRGYLLEWLDKNNSKHYGGVQARVLVGEQIISNAVYLRQEVPENMNPGETATVSITMRNTGQSTWTDSDNYMLGSWNPEDNNTWDIKRVALDQGMAQLELIPEGNRSLVPRLAQLDALLRFDSGQPIELDELDRDAERCRDLATMSPYSRRVCLAWWWIASEPPARCPGTAPASPDADTVASWPQRWQGRWTTIQQRCPPEL